MLSNAYFLAKFRFDTAENEPAKKLQNFANFPNFANPNSVTARDLDGRAAHVDALVLGRGYGDGDELAVGRRAWDA